MTDWRIRRGNAPIIGPVPTERVIRAIESGRLPSDAEVQRIGQETWTRITDIAEFNQAYAAVAGSSEPPTRIMGSSVAPASDHDDEATRIMTPGAMGAPPVPRGLGALSRPPEPPRFKPAAARTTARAIPFTATRGRDAAPPVQRAPAPSNRPDPGPRAFPSDPGLDDERTRVMAPASRPLMNDAHAHGPKSTRKPEQDRPRFAESSAVRTGRLPPRPHPPTTPGRDEVSQSDITQLRDAIEEDEAEEARRSHPSERHPPRQSAAPMENLAIAVGAHIPGGDRAGKAASASVPPRAVLPSVSVHPDHDRTSPALRALRHGPAQTIRILVVIVVILTVALCVSITMQLRG